MSTLRANANERGFLPPIKPPTGGQRTSGGPRSSSGTKLPHGSKAERSDAPTSRSRLSDPLPVIYAASKRPSVKFALSVQVEPSATPYLGDHGLEITDDMRQIIASHKGSDTPLIHKRYGDQLFFEVQKEGVAVEAKLQRDESGYIQLYFKNLETDTYEGVDPVKVKNVLSAYTKIMTRLDENVEAKRANKS